MLFIILLLLDPHINYLIACLSMFCIPYEKYMTHSQLLDSRSKRSLENIAFPSRNSCWTSNISIDISNCQMIWINIWLSSNNNWIHLAKLVQLARINWILHLRAPSLLAWLIECLTGSSQRGLSILEGLLRSSHDNFLISTSINSSTFILAFLHLSE